MTKALQKIIICLFLTSIDAVDVLNDFPATGGNSIIQSGTSNSVFQSNGNNVIISRRMGPDNVEHDYISISNPDVRIDGDYCKMKFVTFNRAKLIFFQSRVLA